MRCSWVATPVPLEVGSSFVLPSTHPKRSLSHSCHEMGMTVAEFDLPCATPAGRMNSLILASLSPMLSPHR